MPAGGAVKMVVDRSCCGTVVVARTNAPVRNVFDLGPDSMTVILRLRV
jgi:hypothetical protein